MNYIKDLHKDIVKRSHCRCITYGVEKERIFSRKILKGNDKKIKIENNKNLIKVAVPFMNILQEILQGSGFFILLTDKEGCILNVVGDNEILDEAKKMNMVVGAYMDEKNMGTNAMGVTIKENIPVQISDKDHFVNAYQKWTCSAAPIHNINGNIIGSINLTGEKHKVHKHTLGLAVAAVKSIENQLKADEINKKLKESYQYMKTIIDSMSYGIYTINSEGIIKSINRYACLMLDIDEKEILNKCVSNILPEWKTILRKIRNGNAYTDKESIINIGRNNRYNISATPIKLNCEIVGMVVVIKEMQNVFNLVNKYSGMRAIYTFNDIIGESEIIQEIIEYSKIIASSPSTVLIQGESGTGKELLAQSIHNYSNRSNKTFIALNCGAIPKSLIESELFGYEDGAFTGAKRGGHAGKFELANGGTLFLDEIGEMPLDMQVKLLRVLQEKYVSRLGGDKFIPVDVRIIAATNKDLEQEVKKGTFREDLYYRLRVIPIRMPSLRERYGDVEILIKYYLKMKSSKLNKPIPKIEDCIMDTMLEYSWPGNIRELENYIENLVNLEGKTTYELKLGEKNNKKKQIILNCEKKDEVSSLEEMEIKHIKRCILICDGNISKSAKILGIGRNTLYSKIKKYNILI